MKTICACGSNKQFKKCCARFIHGGEFAKTPEQLMRSRYTAYAFGGYGEYLLATCLPAVTQNLTSEVLSERSCEWLGLEILTKSQKGDEGTVEFNAFFRREDGKREALHEKSLFKRIDGHWFYADGKVDSKAGKRQ